MKTVEEIQREIVGLELEQAECEYGSFEYDCIDSELQYLYGLLMVSAHAPDSSSEVSVSI
jgi:hypothetical protein